MIVKDALRRMYDSSPEHPDGENIFYYLTVYNEPYVQPAAPAVDGLDAGILRGMYKYAPAAGARRRSRPAGAGARLGRGDAVGAVGPAAAGRGLGGGGRRVVGHLVDRAAARTRSRASRTTCCNPGSPRQTPYVTSALADSAGPVVAVSDWMRAVPDQISRWVPSSSAYTSLGTDGFGFSDTRPAARRFFHVDAESITLAVLAELARSGAVDASLPAQAIAKYKLDLPVSEALG